MNIFMTCDFLLDRHTSVEWDDLKADWMLLKKR